MKRLAASLALAVPILGTVTTAAVASSAVGDAESRIMTMAVSVVAAVAVGTAAILTYQVKRVLICVDRIPEKKWFDRTDEDHESLKILLAEHKIIHCRFPEPTPIPPAREGA
jgi:hypothetical protein